jgi:regulatory protein
MVSPLIPSENSAHAAVRSFLSPLFPTFVLMFPEPKKGPRTLYEKAEHYCAWQERCHKELKQKLYEWGAGKQEAEAVILHCIEHNFLNEERFAKAFAGGKFRTKGWGRQKIVRELKARDITEYCIRKAMLEIPEEDYLLRLRKWIESRPESRASGNVFTRRAKLAKFLMTKGYETDLIWDLLKEMLPDEH